MPISPVQIATQTGYSNVEVLSKANAVIDEKLQKHWRPSYDISKTIRVCVDFYLGDNCNDLAKQITEIYENVEWEVSFKHTISLDPKENLPFGWVTFEFRSQEEVNALNQGYWKK